MQTTDAGAQLSCGGPWPIYLGLILALGRPCGPWHGPEAISELPASLQLSSRCAVGSGNGRQASGPKESHRVHTSPATSQVLSSLTSKGFELSSTESDLDPPRSTQSGCSSSDSDQA